MTVKARARAARHSTWLLTAAAVTNAGDGLTNTALPLLALLVTHKPLAIAAVSAASRLPWLGAAVAGTLVDRVANTRRLVTGVELVRTAIVGAVAAIVASTGHMALGLIAGAAFLLTAGETVVSVAVQRAAALSVEPQQLPRLLGRLRFASSAGEYVAGPAAGGVLFAVARAVPFGLDAVSYLGNAGLLRPVLPTVKAWRAPTGGFWSDLVDGARTARGVPIARRSMALTALLSFCQFVGYGILPLWATRSEHLGAAGYGTLLAVANVGELVGSAGTGWLNDTLGSTAAVGLGAACASLSYVGLAFVHNAIAAGALLALEAVSVSSAAGILTAARLTSVPPHLMGRVSALAKTGVYGVMPIAAMAGGWLGSVGGLGAPWLAGGLLGLASVAIFLPRLAAATAQPPNGLSMASGSGADH
ncbi:MAG TPA: MFS transporter [Acidimicrobiales bacterium]|nr:MFS transporter [Acidimicrobiales bacterium]